MSSSRACSAISSRELLGLVALHRVAGLGDHVVAVARERGAARGALVGRQVQPRLARRRRHSTGHVMRRQNCIATSRRYGYGPDRHVQRVVLPRHAAGHLARAGIAEPPRCPAREQRIVLAQARGRVVERRPSRGACAAGVFQASIHFAVRAGTSIVDRVGRAEPLEQRERRELARAACPPSSRTRCRPSSGRRAITRCRARAAR